MTLGGWLTMIASVGGTTFWLIWCIYKVVTTPEESKKIHGFDRKTPDQDAAP